MRFLPFFKTRTPEPFTLTPFECTREGLTIRGTQYRPEGTGLPAAIVCHGFMLTQKTVARYARTLARQGYCTFTFDFCGGSALHRGTSDGETTAMSVLTEIRDLEAVIAHVRSLPHIGSGLLLMGCSQGGFVSALTAAKHPGLADKLVLFYPALCIPDDARSGKMMLARFDPANIPDSFSCGPMKLGKCYVSDVLDMDPYEQICSYSGPVLIVHGTKDSIVSPDYSQRAREAYPNAQLLIIPGAGHGFRRQQDAVAMERLRLFAANTEA